MNLFKNQWWLRLLRRLRKFVIGETFTTAEIELDPPDIQRREFIVVANTPIEAATHNIIPRIGDTEDCRGMVISIDTERWVLSNLYRVAVNYRNLGTMEVLGIKP
jgi:hypothetical protein